MESKSANLIEKQSLTRKSAMLGRKAISEISVGLLAGVAVGVPLATTLENDRRDVDNPASVSSIVNHAPIYGKEAVMVLTGDDYCPDPPSPEDTDIFFADEPIYSPEADPYEILAETGLTIPDNEESYQALNEMFDTSDRGRIVEIFNDFTEREYGISTSLEGFDGEYASELVDTKELAGRLSDLAGNMFLIPKELISASGVKEIEVRPLISETREDEHGDVARGRYIYRAGGSTIQFDISSVDSKDVLYHEMLGHGMHFEACNGFGLDQGSMDFYTEDSAISNSNPDGYVHERDDEISGPVTDPREAAYFVDKYQKKKRT